jgi:CRP-like cAMP-binding protein
LIEYDLFGALTCWGRRTGLTARDFDALGALPWVLKAIERDAFIVREGERPTSCALLLAGCAFRQKVVREGSRQIVSFHFPGEFVDLQGLLLAVNDHNVQALTTCELAVVPKNTLLTLIEQRPTLAQSLWFDTLAEAAIFREWVVNVGRRNARARIAHLLCELVVRLGNTSEGRRVYYIPITQEQIADATGMTPVHTNRTLQALRKEGLITFSGGRLAVHDWKALRAVAEFSELYLHKYPARS